MRIVCERAYSRRQLALFRPFSIIIMKTFETYPWMLVDKAPQVDQVENRASYRI